MRRQRVGEAVDRDPACRLERDDDAIQLRIERRPRRLAISSAKPGRGRRLLAPQGYQYASITEPLAPTHQTSMLSPMRETAVMPPAVEALPPGASSVHYLLSTSSPYQVHLMYTRLRLP